jgi:radical SAM protein with 4Fe4S-binding SPASM domain
LGDCDIKKHIIQKGIAASCYFRSTVEPPYRKALLQITERCNLFCAHCFVSSGNYGDMMPFEAIRDTLMPMFKKCRVISVTLTGGEPFVHPDIINIVILLVEAGIQVGICTNATLINSFQIEKLAGVGNVHINVSLDGFRENSHSKFRGNQECFSKTIETIKILSRYGLLQGILVTPNNLANIEEYIEICKFAVANHAKYVLINPLSGMGRGVKSKNKLATSKEFMIQLRELTTQFIDKIELAYIRFPNDDLPLAACEAGNIIYVFVHGELTICPYLVFAAKTPNSKHKPEEFIIGNIFDDSDIAERLDNYKFYQRYRLGNNQYCTSCHLNSKCKKGCPAAIIASGQRIEGIDQEICPIYNNLEESLDAKT